MQSIHFCKLLECSIEIYIPQSTRFLMYFENDVTQVDLDSSYLTAPDTAREHALDLVTQAGLTPEFFEPKNYTASTLPDIPTDYDFMCCPRSISDLSSKIGLGYIGPRVRKIVQSAHFPVIITNGVFKPWTSIAVFFGGSINAVKSLKLGLRIARKIGFGLNLITQVEHRKADHYERIIKENHLQAEVDQHVQHWFRFESNNLEENLYAIPHDALAVLGAYGHGLIKEIVFGSKMEKIQSTIPNNLLIVGPNFTSVV